ncbi:MAG: polyribonucleotide nucleotidyltransferase [Deltaproteobacteria bacterium]|nr:polyribonucleotide nucleotidyltransferase [Deltaproteobacteria bacterium]
MIVRESVKIGDRLVTLEVGRIAKQAHGAVLVTCGESIVLVTVVGDQQPRPGHDFVPLSVDYQEKTYAAGKIPGGYFRREAKLHDNEILISRLIDRPCRPLFPKGYRNEVQLIATVMSADKDNPCDVLAMIGAPAALHISPIPWEGPVASARVCRVNGKLIANPTWDEIVKSDIEIIVSASKDAIVMVEGECREVSEDDFIKAVFFGKDAVQGVIELIEKMRAAVGREKWTFEKPDKPDGIDERMKDMAYEPIKAACRIADKSARAQAFRDARNLSLETMLPELPEHEKAIRAAFEELQYTTMRAQVLETKTRVDGRDTTTVRPITIEVGLLPRAHGSTLFTRGETQAICTCTLATSRYEQKIEGLIEEEWKRFMLHYNFPPYCVGEIKMLRGPGRREIGHGNLAERSFSAVLPSKSEFPYTIRLVSEITESNGSSSMATVCGGTMALMDAGVPMKAPVAGIAMGLIKTGDDYVILTDILGDEDHLGDMDFKVCGTTKGVTAIQMDIKIKGLTKEIVEQALAQAREARLHVLGKMTAILAAPRPELSAHAPRITTIKVKPDQIRTVIGPGGKMIKAIVDQTGASIDVEDDGTVAIASPDAESVDKAIAIIRSLTMTPEVGQVHMAKVVRIEPYGAFLEFAPDKDGLLHISELDWKRAANVEDYLKMGDEIEVKIIEVDRDGRVRFSRKDLIPKPEGWEDRASSPRRSDRAPRSERDDRGGGRGDRHGSSRFSRDRESRNDDERSRGRSRDRERNHR